MGFLYCLPLGKSLWIQVLHLQPGKSLDLCVENRASATFSVDVESAETKGGVLTSLFSTVNINPKAKTETTLPKIPNGETAVQRKWTKITIGGSGQGFACIKITGEGIVHTPIVE